MPEMLPVNNKDLMWDLFAVEEHALAKLLEAGWEGLINY